MFQSYALFPHMSVERNIGYGLEREGVGKARGPALGSRRSLETVGLAP